MTIISKTEGDMIKDVKTTVRTDGKRKVIVASGRFSSEEIDLSFCRNGYQTTVVTIDKEMLHWLRYAIDEHLGA